MLHIRLGRDAVSALFMRADCLEVYQNAKVVRAVYALFSTPLA